MPHYFADPFQESDKDSKPTFAFYSGENGWTLISPGPDGDFDIDPEQDYVPRVTQPSSYPELVRKEDDPTNGIESDGGIFRVKQ